MTTQELLDSLTAVHSDESITVAGGYIDWSTVTRRHCRILEVGDDSNRAVQLVLTRDDLLKLHAALTVTLLRDAQEA